MNTKKILKIGLPLILGGFLVWYSLSKISIETLFEYFKNANYWWIGLGLLFGILSHLSRAYRWKYLLEPMGYKPDFGNNIMAVLIAYLVNYVIPRAGEVFRATVLYNYENVPFEKGFGTIVAERIADLLMFAIIILITLFIQFDFVYSLIINNFNPIKILILLAVFIVSFCFFVIYIKNSKTGFALKLKNFVTGLIEGASSIFKIKHKWAFMLHTAFIWAMYICMFWGTIRSIKGLEVQFGAVLIGFIAGAFSIATTNGGIGLYPVAVAGALTLFSIDQEPANAFGWIMWVAQTTMIIVFGGLSFLLLPFYNKEK